MNELDLTLDNTLNVEISMNEICSDVCFGTWSELTQYKDEQIVLLSLKQPIVKPITMLKLNASKLPRKKDPVVHHTENTYQPKNVSLPYKKLPWSK